MIFQIDEYFKKHDCSINNYFKKTILNFCSLISKNFEEYKIDKFTVVLGDDKKVDVAINNDSNRKFIKLKTLDTLLGEATLTNTKIDNVKYSDIPMVFVNGNDKFFDLIEYLKNTANNFMPKGYKIGSHSGSMYIIFNKKFIGQLWNVHTDPFPTKAHWVITDCEEEFIWFKKNWSKSEKIENNKFYFYNVNVPHTVKILKYVKKQPRIHIVYDINQIDL